MKSINQNREFDVIIFNIKNVINSRKYKSKHEDIKNIYYSIYKTCLILKNQLIQNNYLYLEFDVLFFIFWFMWYDINKNKENSIDEIFLICELLLEKINGTNRYRIFSNNINKNNCFDYICDYAKNNLQIMLDSADNKSEYEKLLIENILRIFKYRLDKK